MCVSPLHYEVCEEDTCVYVTFTYQAAYKAACTLMQENALKPWNIKTTTDALQYAKKQG